MRHLLDWLARVGEQNEAATVELAEQICRTHAEGGLLYTTGSGHSLAMVMETFYRAGGLAEVRPVLDPDTLPFNGAMASTEAERVEGSGTRALDGYPVGPHDTLIVFSNTGRNPFPVEVALAAKERGAMVAAFTSVAVSRSAPSRSSALLCDVADIVLDTQTPPGDISEPAHDPVTSPLSTIACAVLWSRVLAHVAANCPDVPFWRSANLDGNEGHNEGLVARLRVRIPEL